MSPFSSAYNFFAALFAMLGDSAFLGTVSLLCILYFFAIRFARGAVTLLLAYLGCGALVASLKIFFMACHQSFPTFDLHSPSGHAAMSVAVYGTLAVLIVRNCKGWRGYTAIIGAPLLSLSIAFSRVYFGHHSVDEIGVGLLAGSCVALAAYAVMRKQDPVAFRIRYVALLCLIPVIVFFGSYTHFEGLLGRLSFLLNSSFLFCA